jgi:hypothetical protein
MVDFVDSPIVDIPEIAIDETGLFTPASAYAIKLSADLVNKCVELAESKDADFATKMDALTNATTGFLVTHEAADVTAGSITAPTPTEPSMTVGDTSTALVFSNFSTQAAAVISDAATKFSNFWAAYFPDNATTYDAAEAYLLDAIPTRQAALFPLRSRQQSSKTRARRCWQKPIERRRTCTKRSQQSGTGSHRERQPATRGGSPRQRWTTSRRRRGPSPSRTSSYRTARRWRRFAWRCRRAAQR